MNNRYKNLLAAAILILIVSLVAYSITIRQPQELSELLIDVPSDSTARNIMERAATKAAVREPVQVYAPTGMRNATASARKLRDEGFKVRQYASFPLDPPIDWSADPHEDANWRYQLNALYPGRTYLRAYARTGNQQWFQQALSLYLDWIEFNLDNSNKNDFKWHDMATGMRAMGLAALLDHGLRNDYLTEDQFEQLVRAAHEHLIQLSEVQPLTESNHGLFQVAGIAALCHGLPDFRICDTARPYANDGFAYLFDLQFNREGMHLEHSPEYHHLGLNVIDELAGLGWFEPSDRHMKKLAAAKANFNWLAKPDKTFPAIGDTDRRIYSSAKKHDPALRYLLSDGRGGKRPKGGVKVFPDTGYGFIRHYEDDDDVSASSYIMFTVAHHSRIHKHADAFSFEWYDAGRPMLIDSGKWGYDNVEERAYVVSTRAHNTVEINDQDDAILQPPEVLPRIIGRLDNGTYALTANGKRQPFDIAQRRVIALLPGQWLLLADSFDRDGRYVQWLHPAEDLACHASENLQTFLCGEAGDGFRVQPLLPVDEVVHHRGSNEPRMQGWVSPSYGVLQPADALGYVLEQGGGRQFVTLLQVGADSAPVEPLEVRMSDRGMRVCWKEATSGERQGVRISFGENDSIDISPCAPPPDSTKVEGGAE